MSSAHFDWYPHGSDAVHSGWNLQNLHLDLSEELSHVFCSNVLSYYWVKQTERVENITRSSSDDRFEASRSSHSRLWLLSAYNKEWHKHRLSFEWDRCDRFKPPTRKPYLSTWLDIEDAWWIKLTVLSRTNTLLFKINFNNQRTTWSWRWSVSAWKFNSQKFLI